MREDEVNWAQGQRATMAAFLAYYTLHDSVLDQFTFSPDGSALLTIDWDPVWLERPFAQAGLPPPAMNNYSLYLKFAHVLDVRIDEVALDTIPVVNGTIGDAETQALSAAQRTDLRDVLELLIDTEKPSGPVRREPEIPDGAHCAVVRTI